ncbi:hypothetical protein P5V15_001254 [Pogonomyrmex californicus]
MTKPVTFYIVADDFPIPQFGILGNDFFKQTLSKIDYAQGRIDVSGIQIPFLSLETIVASPRSESLFYVRVGNPNIKIGYVPKLKIIHRIYLEDTVVENLGKNIFKYHKHTGRRSRGQVPIINLKSLNEMVDLCETRIKTLDYQKELTNSPKFLFEGNRKQYRS